MGARSPDMQPVDLVEVDAGGGAPSPGGWPAGWAGGSSGGWSGGWSGGTPGPDPSGGPAPAGSAPGDVPGRRAAGPTRAVRRRLLAAAVVAGLAVGTAAVASERQERARLESFADVPGVVEPLTEPLVEVWRSDEGVQSHLTVVGDLVVGVTSPRARSQDVAVVALEAATGRTRWRTTLVPAGGTTGGRATCVVPEATPGVSEDQRVVVCHSVDELGPSPRDLSRVEPRAARLLVLAVADGELLLERSVDPSTSIDALGTDIVVKTTLTDGRLRIARTDPTGERSRWTFLTDPRILGREFSPVLVDDALVVVPGAEGWILTADGDVGHRWEPSRPTAAAWADVQRGAVMLRPLRDLIGRTDVVELSTGRGFTTDGFPLRPWTDDGSSGDLVLVQGSRGQGLMAQRLGSGDVVWTVPGDDTGGTLVLDGRVLRVEEGLLRSMDVDTGETVWQADVPASRHYGLYTDGRLVLRAEPDADRRTVLAARGLDDGRLRWTSPVTESLQQLIVLDRRIVGLTEDGLVAFGPASG